MRSLKHWDWGFFKGGGRRGENFLGVEGAQFFFRLGFFLLGLQGVVFFN